MKLKGDLYNVVDLHKDADKIEYILRLNPSHFIYQAHFPGNPVTPGVCILQIVKELSMEHLQCDLFLKKISKVRFLHVIHPVENNQVNLTLTISQDDHSYKATATVYNQERTFTQLSLILENTNG
ncbi:MAG: hypothetical protein LBQ60_11490 [Bacteroidales bacterium]|nr:hypothetical protein [Bacteroidales bacterium]